MRLYDCRTAPNPRRVRMYLAEKGIVVPLVEVDLRRGEQLQPAFLARNPWATVPVLELDDGTCIAESIAICRYFEALSPDPALFGDDARMQGLVEMWNRRLEFDLLLAVAEAFRNATPGLRGRALTGADDYPQIPALAERGRTRALATMRRLDAVLADGRAFVSGDAFSVADITGFVALEFARWAHIDVPGELAALRRWHERVSARPSAGA